LITKFYDGDTESTKSEEVRMLFSPDMNTRIMALTYME